MLGVNLFLELLKIKSLEENIFKQRPSEQTQELPKLALGQLQKNVQKVPEIWCVKLTSPPLVLLVRTTVG